MLVPPENFGLVEEGIYRCARLDPLNFAFLDTLNLKSLILLDAEKPPRVLVNFFEDRPIRLCYVGRSGLKVMEKHDNPETTATGHDAVAQEGSSSSETFGNMEDWMIIRSNVIADIFQIMFDKSKHNVMIVDKTEAIIGLLRKLQKWSFSNVINEYRLYAGNRSTYATETFLELVGMELISFEENQYRKKEAKEKEAKEAPKREGIKMAAHRRSISSRSTSLSSNLEDLDVDDVEFDKQQNDELSLSASPQIPQELLKLAKQRKLKKKDTDTQPANDNTSYQKYKYYKSYGIQFDTSSSENSNRSRIKILLPEEKSLPPWFVSQRDDWEMLFHASNRT